MRIRIGDPDETVAGTQTYVVRYHLVNVVNGFADHAEFYYNVVDAATTSPTGTSRADGDRSRRRHPGASASAASSATDRVHSATPGATGHVHR